MDRTIKQIEKGAPNIFQPMTFYGCGELPVFKPKQIKRVSVEWCLRPLQCRKDGIDREKNSSSALLRRASVLKSCGARIP